MILTDIPNYIYILILNCVGIAILILILKNTKFNKNSIDLNTKLFLYMILSNIIILIADTLTWMVDKKEGFDNLNRIINCIYFALNPLLTLVWAIYLDYKLFSDKKRLKKILPFYLIPFTINFIMSFANLFTDVIFTIKDGNEYQRLPLIYVSILSSYIYIVYSLIITIANRRKVSKVKYNALIIFLILPIISSIIQMLFYGISLVWISEALSCLIIFLNIQNDNFVTDMLTGIYNRKYLDDYILNRINNNEIYSAIMIDIDNFKKINDSYGHIVGDHALMDMATILNKSISSLDSAVRYAGDEFIILVHGNDENRIKEIIHDLKINTNDFNNKKEEPYILEYSLGFYISNHNDTLDSFIKQVDDNMYLEKNKKIKRGSNHE